MLYKTEWTINVSDWWGPWDWSPMQVRVIRNHQWNSYWFSFFLSPSKHSGNCCGLNAPIPQNSHVGLCLQHVGIWRWGLWEVIRSWWWGPALVRKYMRELVLSLSLFSALWGYKKKMPICKSGKGLSPDIRSASTLILNF